MECLTMASELLPLDLKNEVAKIHEWNWLASKRYFTSHVLPNLLSVTSPLAALCNTVGDYIYPYRYARIRRYHWSPDRFPMWTLQLSFEPFDNDQLAKHNKRKFITISV